ncbi:methionine ABC transporter permease [Treponema zioleckii]|uniref:methionine ABC transporter permease n=1 Tax=Treponema zioleckii TaxID=331680 RepID=UPI00168B3C01|nr:methionine ABC transporter permease [Treponema zioleckii]
MIFGVKTAKILTCVFQTLYMVSVPLVVGALIGFPLAVILVITRKGGIKQNAVVYNTLNIFINIVRSVPFIILIVSIMPFTKFIVGTRVGSTAALLPLTCFIAPFLARLLESALLGVDKGIIEAAQALGATTMQTIFRFMLPEASGALILGITTGAVGLLGATAMAGAVGGGGVGDLAITYGYQRFNQPLMIATVIVLIGFVQLIQGIGNGLSKKAQHK